MDNNYKGMTVNERLWASGLSDEFYKAVKEKDANKVTRILEEVELTKPNIEPILEKYGLKPKE
jgi:molecular chaperone GrpE (heat shock protein)